METIARSGFMPTYVKLHGTRWVIDFPCCIEPTLSVGCGSLQEAR